MSKGAIFGSQEHIDRVSEALVEVEFITANRTLTADDSGKLFVFNIASGATITLPGAFEGLHYDFFVKTAVTSNDYGIDTDATDNFEGCLVVIDKDQAYSSTEALQKVCPAAGSEVHIDMNGSTKGGLAGSRLKLVAINNDRWVVEGILVGDGNLASPLS